MPKHLPAQCRAYAKFLQEKGANYNWVGFIDTDEFIVPKTADTLTLFLEAYESFGGLGVFWQCFGSNGFATRQPSVIRAFTKCAPNNWGSNNHIKSIIQPRFTLPVAAPTPHHFKYANGYNCVDENGVSIRGARRWPRSTAKVQLNHYITRSREECLWKLERGGGNSNRNARSKSFFKDNDAPCNQIEDTTILHLVDRLRQS